MHIRGIVRATLGLLAIVGAFAAPLVATAEEPARAAKVVYPPTPKGDAFDTMHGERVADPYRWLEDDEAPAVVAWDLAQEALVRSTLDAFPRRAAIESRLRAELDLESAKSLPTFEGGRQWYLQRSQGQNHPVLYAKDADGAGDAKVVLDPNAWSADGTEGLRGHHASPDGKWLAYLRDSKGSENSTLFLRDLTTGQDADLRLPRMKFASVTWAPDSSGFYYTRLPDPASVPVGQEQQHRRVYFHPLGGLVLDDELVYGSGRPAIESMSTYASSDRKTLFLARGEPYRTNETFEIVRKAGKTTLVPVWLGVPGLSYVDKVGDVYVVNTDWEAPRRRLLAVRNRMRIEVSDAVPTTGRAPADLKIETILPQGTGVIESADLVGDAVLVHSKDDVVSHLRVIGVNGADRGEVALPGPGTVHDVVTKPGDTRVWFSFDAYDRPWTSYVVDLASKDRALTAIETAPTSIDVSTLTTTRVRYPSKDGTEIPMFLVHRKDVALDGKAPTVLTGYGGFRLGRGPGWSPLIGLWAEMGGVTAVACLRGGDEFGEAWHEAGCLDKKQNVFDDFIAAADWLVANGQATRERLAIQGGSNGGLLVAAVTNQRPDLCRAVVCQVPLTDMLRFHRFQFAKIWTKEYGDPDVEAEYRWIRPYSPYHNAKPAAYPAVLLTAGLKDGRVNAFHARKMAATWQSLTTSDRPILVSVDRDSGHGSASRKQLKAEQVDRFCFLLQQLQGAP